MSGRRVLALYGALLLGFAAVVCRLYWLCSNTEYAVRAEAQSEAVLRLPAARGNFYDCGGLPLTGISQRWLALCFPGESSYARLYPYADADGQARLYRERNTSRPFLLDVVQDVSGLGVRCYAVPRRYAAAPLAEQLIGYLDSEGHGAAGLEAALDDVLYTGERDTLHCAVTAQGRLRRGSEPILEKADSAPQGVRLTLSRSIQRAAEGVAAESMATGCILIIDAASGKVRACVSLPGFDAANVGESLTAPDSPLLNRAFSAYAVGSVFKPVLAAAALEAGEGDFIRECPGYDALNGQVYRCAGSVPHGLVGLDGALEKSCNGYFIELGRELGPERVRKMAAALGFGKGQDIADGLRSASGVLPEAETLENEGQFANFCFGQGELLATPLQVAGMMNTIAAGGVYHTPLFVECTVDETTGEELTPLAHGSSRRVFSEQTAEKLHPNDVRRVMRALEIYETSGKTKSEQADSARAEGKYHVLVYGLSQPREIMYARINARVDEMMEAGLVNEVKALLTQGVKPNCEGGAMQAIGYKEIVSALQGDISMERAVELIKQNSRRYAKRQWTWFRHDAQTKWFDYTDFSTRESLEDTLLQCIQADCAAYAQQA